MDRGEFRYNAEIQQKCYSAIIRVRRAKGKRGAFPTRCLQRCAPEPTIL